MWLNMRLFSGTRSFNSENALQAHSKAKHGAKWRQSNNMMELEDKISGGLLFLAVSTEVGVNLLVGGFYCS